MAKSKGAHAADLDAERRVASARSFFVTMQIGPNDRPREDCATLAEARAFARRVNEAHGTWGRRAMIYAIDTAGVALIVPGGDAPLAESA